MDFQLNGQVAVVTGASRGLGRAIATALADEGVRILATGRSAAQLDELAALRDGSIVAQVCDMRDLPAVGRLATRAVEEFGRLDIVVNNAGIAPAGPLTEQGDEIWREVFETNVLGPVALTRAAGRYLLPQESGKIVNIASTAGILGKPTLAAYSASKGALLQFTKALSGEWARAGVQVNAIAPGAFKTEAQKVVLESEALLARRLRKIPAGRMAEVHEIGPLACLLASPLSNYVTGSVFVMDGGEVSRL